MSDSTQIRCKTQAEFDKARKSIESLLGVETEEHRTPFGISYIFSALGIDGAIFPSDPTLEADRGFEEFDLVIDLMANRNPAKQYPDANPVAAMALYLGSMINEARGWEAIVLDHGKQTLTRFEKQHK